MQKLMQWTAVFGTIFALTALVLIFYMGSHKVVVVAEAAAQTAAAQESTAQESTTETTESEQAGKPVKKAASTTQDMSIYIPLESRVKADGISIRNRRLNQELEVSLKNATADFYDTQQITGNTDLLKEVSYTVSGHTVKLNLEFAGVYECNSRLTNGMLQINFLQPAKQYDTILVLDDRSRTGDQEEAKILSGIADGIIQALSSSNIKVYETASAGEEIDDDCVAALVNSLPADLYVGLSLGRDTNSPASIGTLAVYNATYFQPGISNAETADALERGVVTAVSGKADGLQECTKSSLLYQLQVPAAIIYPGYLTNEQEMELLKNETYQDMIGEGICKAIQEIVTIIGGK